MLRLSIAIVLGLVLGWAGGHALFLGWWTLLPWGLAAGALGYRANRVNGLMAGALYGFVLCFVFILAGYAGAAPAVKRIPFFAAFGLVGAVCGLALGLLGAILLSGSATGAPPRDDAA